MNQNIDAPQVTKFHTYEHATSFSNSRTLSIMITVYSFIFVANYLTYYPVFQASLNQMLLYNQFFYSNL